MSYLYDLLFFFNFILIIINRIFRHTCSFAYLLEYIQLILVDNVVEESE